MHSPGAEELLRLALRLPWPLDDTVGAAPAPAEQVDAFEAEFGRALSPELRDWLGVCNGARIAQGGVFGLRPDDQFVDIRARLRLNPEWAELGWVPVAGDGCGSTYSELPAAPNRDVGWVGFVDCFEDQDRISYLVASNISRFLWFLFADDLDVEHRWPSDREYVLAHDPEMGLAPANLQPWAE